MRVVPDSQMTDVCRQLFGEDEDAVGELDEAEKQGVNGISRAFNSFHSKEITVPRREAASFQAVRSALCSTRKYRKMVF